MVSGHCRASFLERPCAVSGGASVSASPSGSDSRASNWRVPSVRSAQAFGRQGLRHGLRPNQSFKGTPNRCAVGRPLIPTLDAIEPGFILSRGQCQIPGFGFRISFLLLPLGELSAGLICHRLRGVQASAFLHGQTRSLSQAALHRQQLRLWFSDSRASNGKLPAVTSAQPYRPLSAVAWRT